MYSRLHSPANDIIIGYVEAKDIGIDCYGKDANKAQQDARKASHLIYTNCLDWDLQGW